MMNRVAVRIVRRGEKYFVIGRKTTEVFDNFDGAWVASIPYFAGRKY